jgi:hypothetical protein
MGKYTVMMHLGAGHLGSIDPIEEGNELKSESTLNSCPNCLDNGVHLRSPPWGRSP